MGIGWVNADGKAGYSEDAYQFAMQSAEQSNKSSRIELTPQQRIDQAFGEPNDDLGYPSEDVNLPPKYVDQGNPMNWGLKNALQSQGTATGKREEEISEDIGKGFKLMPGEALPISATSGLPSDQLRLDKKSENADYQKFAEYVRDLKLPDPEAQKIIGVAKDFWQNVLGPTISEGILNPIMASGPPLIPGARGLKGPVMNWPKGWGTTPLKVEKGTFASGGAKISTADYPHVQQAFKEAMEAGATTIPQIADHMTFNGTPATPAIVQSLRNKAGLTQAPAERWSSEKTDTFMKLVNEGKTDREISTAMGITRNSVIGKISRLQEADPSFERNVNSPPTKSTMPGKVDRIRELAEAGMPANDIGKELGHTGAYIRQLSSVAGIELPRDPKSPGGGGRKNPNTNQSDWYQYIKRRLESK